MAKGSKGIGIRAELEACRLIEKCGFKGMRRSQQFKGTSDSADVIGNETLASVAHLEIKNVKTFLTKMMMRAYIKASKECNFMQTPVLVHRYPVRKGMSAAERKLAKRWLVTVDARFFFTMLRKVI